MNKPAQIQHLKSAACAAIDTAAADLADIAGAIWSDPELAFQERRAHDRLTEFLEARGFQVTRNYILDTAFKASISSLSNDNHEAPISVGLMCEYDALPGIGHACGHNLIAEVALAAALGLQAAVTSSSKMPDDHPAERRRLQVTVFGTPAEEGGGGKVALATGGAFRGLDAALMAHPYRRCEARPLVLARLTVLAEFQREQPAGESNPMDAVALAYQAISCLRANLRRHCMLHCVLRSTPGGDQHHLDDDADAIAGAPGWGSHFTPKQMTLEYYLRAPSQPELADLRRKLVACFEAAAMATGCRVIIADEDQPAYSSLLSNRLLSDAYAANLLQLGGECLAGDSDEPAGSTDMGNVSHLVPSIHPMWRLLDLEESPDEPPPNHSLEFTRLAGCPAAQGPALRQAKALAMTAIDILWGEDAEKVGSGGASLRDRVWAEFLEGQQKLDVNDEQQNG